MKKFTKNVLGAVGAGAILLNVVGCGGYNEQKTLQELKDAKQECVDKSLRTNDTSKLEELKNEIMSIDETIEWLEKGIAERDSTNNSIRQEIQEISEK
ncbi:MAG: hypothetical protein LBM01_02470 [Christensenellaceae bacterium]|jgi:septal ring factor EnvC (AmiA/AmiB activator)|nr:hypothetical protein [Christensenellaceae bacterium]